MVPGFLDRYAATFAPDEVAFYERFGESAGNWFAARPAGRSLVHSDYRPDNLLFSQEETPSVAVVDWQGFTRGSAMSDVSFVIGNALDTRGAARTRGATRAHLPRTARRRPGCRRTRSTSAGTTTGARCSRRCSPRSSARCTALRTERGDRMFELMGARHARQILDLGADRFLDD